MPNTPYYDRSQPKQEFPWQTLLGKTGYASVPLLSNLIQGNNVTAGNIGSLGGSLGGTLGNYFGGPYGGLFGGYGGNVLGNLIGGGNIGTSLFRGIPTLGTGLLNLALPEELQGFGSVASPLTTSLLQLGGNAIGEGLGIGSNIFGNAAAGWGAGTSSTISPLLGALANYAGPIGMMLGGALNVIGDISGTHKMHQADREANKQYLSAYQANPWADPIWNAISQYLPPEIQSMTGENAPREEGGALQLLSKAFPTWLQDMLYGTGPVTHAPTAQQMGLVLSMSPLLRTFTPELTQQALGGFQKYLQNPEGYDFSGWSSLPQEVKDKLYKQLINRQGKGESPAPLLASEEWNYLSNLAGTQLDPFTIMGGIYKDLEALEELDLQGEKPGTGIARAIWNPVSSTTPYAGLQGMPRIPNPETFSSIIDWFNNPYGPAPRTTSENVADPYRSYSYERPITYQDIISGKYDYLKPYISPLSPGKG